MKTVALLLLLTYQINRSRLDYSQEEPEHFSWDLGQPDNLIYTDVVIIESIDTEQEDMSFDDY